jgi:transposase
MVKKMNVPEDRFSELVDNLVRSTHISALAKYNARAGDGAIRIGCDEGQTHKSRDFYYSLDNEEGDGCVGNDTLLLVISYIVECLDEEEKMKNNRKPPAVAAEKLFAMGQNTR